MVKWTRNWTKKVKNNFSTFADDLPRPLRILEIGVWEARSALWMLNNLDPAEYIGIDPWVVDPPGNKKFPYNEDGFAKKRKIEELANRNLEPYENAYLIKGRSRDVIVNPIYSLIFKPESFGLIYIDGVHEYDPVTEDAENVWPLVQSGGIVVWDDCITRNRKEGHNPVQKSADAFLADKQFETLFRGVQFGVRKL